MAKQQTYIILQWFGAPTYREASRNDDNKTIVANFDRVTCKRATTARGYLAKWRKEALEQGLQWLFKTYCRDDAHYQIVATPDGYHETEVVLAGVMKDLDKLSKAASKAA